jgi:hypothetical protein
MEALALRDPNVAIVLCDSGTIDGLAYWPGNRERFFEEFGGSLEQETGRYATLIHIARFANSAHLAGLRGESGARHRTEAE